MLRNVECLKLVEGNTDRVEIEAASQREMVELVLDFEALQLENSKK